MAEPGSFWVEGAYFRWIDAFGTKRGHAGNRQRIKTKDFPHFEYLKPPGAEAGSVWVSGSRLCYIDADGYYRELYRGFLKYTPGEPGSIWVEDQSILLP
jgi:hypothetical protein